MKSYPSIPGPAAAPFGRPCVAFLKYDGSNLRWEWTRKRGFCKCGSRTRLFDASDAQFGEAVRVFQESYAGPMEKALSDDFPGVETATFFTEFFGPSSFAGTHKEGEAKELRLFDVQIHRKGILGPKEFVRRFGGLPFAAEIVYEGNFNKDFVARVRAGEFGPPGCEGVVAKGGDGHSLWMAKAKSESYLAKLREVFQGRWIEFAE